MTAEELKQKIRGFSFTVDHDIVMVKLGAEKGYAYNTLLSRALYFSEQGQLTEDGYFFYTISDFEYKTGIKERTQQRIFKSLEARGLIKVKHCGMPKRRYIKVITDDDVINELFNDTREKPKPEPMPKEVKKKIKKPFDMEILKRQINKVAAEQYLDSTDYPENLYNMYAELFSRVGLPEGAISNKAIAGCLNRLQKLDPEYKVVRYFKEYLSVYETLPCKRGHDLGMSNLLTEEMLDVIRIRMVYDPNSEKEFDFGCS